MTQVYFIGAGPGDPELITLKGARLISEANLVLYAGSLVPREIADMADPDARVENSAPLNLEQTHALIMETVHSGGMVARVHTGDPSLYGAVMEQAALLEREKVEYEIVPGVTAAFAAAAASKISFTVPEAVQSLSITRLDGRTPVPGSQTPRALAAHGSAMAVYLSAGDPERLQQDLLDGGLAPDTLVQVAHQVGWPGQMIVRTRLDQLSSTAREHKMNKQTVFLVLPAQNSEARSKLYDPTFAHGCREKS